MFDVKILLNRGIKFLIDLKSEKKIEQASIRGQCRSCYTP